MLSRENNSLGIRKVNAECKHTGEEKNSIQVSEGTENRFETPSSQCTPNQTMRGGR